jgi:murein DD-endopeptidase MepM/ murein hydrolase activator NlpD
MLRRLRSLPTLAGIGAAAGMAVIALLLVGGGGDPARPPPALRAAAEEKPPPPFRARPVEPVAGEVGVAAEVPGPAAATDDPAAAHRGDDAISPGAPSDDEVRRQLEALEREQAKVRRALLNSSAPIRQGSGRFIWPVAGLVTSPFCERRSWEACHPGMDIAAPTGAGIRAADTGQVVLAGSQGGYGNFTCIAHSRTLSTCYAHQSEILVRPGDVVLRGQVIGTVGCTGFCFGPHLHFEVRISGAVVDPAAYL